MTTAHDILETLTSLRDEKQREVLCRFFKTGPGEYGEGDEFLGLRVPQTRAVVREARLSVPLTEIDLLLASPWHEVRLCALLLLVEEMSSTVPTKRRPGDASRRHELAQFYLAHAHQANNWDLVDLSAPGILGQYLLHPTPSGQLPDRCLLDRLAQRPCLWEQRIAIVSTLALIRSGQYLDTLRIATLLLSHPHDLIHKAVGWMLREVGKRDLDLLRTYLAAHLRQMHRTTLRYAIERMTPLERQQWMEG